jgi:hypothetical protein
VSYYITPEEYEEASKNGIDSFNLERRIRLLGWNKKRAVTTPLRRQRNRSEWVEIAERNGIGYQTFMSRVNVYGWNEERAATQPLQDRKEAALKATEKIRVLPQQYLEMAQKNGISYHTFRARIKKGWDAERAATQPVATNKEAGNMGAKKTRELYGDWNRFSFKKEG